MDRHAHWEGVYRTKSTTEVSWYAPHLEDSLRMLTAARAGNGRVIDVGGGASTLVDDLLALGCPSITVLDISEAALAAARTRLGERSRRVNWVAGDITTVTLPPHAFDVWHDRAVFHFLTEASDRAAYRARLQHSLAPGGHVVMATFALDGPQKCSGLPVVRYDAATLQRELGPGFALVEAIEHTHLTPGGNAQRFVLCHFRDER
ncbi:MAG TPA: class I SAM-dependent methyltransferase [Polyangiales bacterium]